MIERSLVPAVQLHCFIGWLHAKAGHNVDCQLKFNAMFCELLGRCFGEGIEQLWVSRLALASGTMPTLSIISHEAGSASLCVHWRPSCPAALFDAQAALKAVARIQRYEALPHRMVTLELALHHFAMGKFESGCALLAQV